MFLTISDSTRKFRPELLGRVPMHPSMWNCKNSVRKYVMKKCPRAFPTLKFKFNGMKTLLYSHRRARAYLLKREF